MEVTPLILVMDCLNSSLQAEGSCPFGPETYTTKKSLFPSAVGLQGRRAPADHVPVRNLESDVDLKVTTSSLRREHHSGVSPSAATPRCNKLEDVGLAYKCRWRSSAVTRYS
uniref:Uncharacterized protein n=1 Tax=Iconisemion striatum TaxID=60296 RepID=A0A1A7XHF3_9TELE